MFSYTSFYASPNTFLLNPKHDRFLNGEERKFKDFGCVTSVLLGFMMLIFAVVGIGMAYAGVNEIITRLRLNQSGVEARAEIINLDFTSSTNKGRTTYTYYITYAYFVRTDNPDQPARYTFRQKVSNDTYNSLSDGSKITVRYLPDSPEISRFVDDTEDDGKLFALIGSLIAGGTLVASSFSLRTRARNRRLEHEGQFIAGKITETNGMSMKSGYQVTLTYTFISPEGSSLTRKESAIRNDLRKKALPAIGTPVAVVYADEKVYRVL